MALRKMVPGDHIQRNPLIKGALRLTEAELLRRI